MAGRWIYRTFSVGINFSDHNMSEWVVIKIMEHSHEVPVPLEEAPS